MHIFKFYWYLIKIIIFKNIGLWIIRKSILICMRLLQVPTSVQLNVILASSLLAYCHRVLESLLVFYCLLNANIWMLVSFLVLIFTTCTAQFIPSLLAKPTHNTSPSTKEQTKGKKRSHWKKKYMHWRTYDFIKEQYVLVQGIE